MSYDLIRNLQTLADSHVDDFMNDEFLCAAAARVAGQAKEEIARLKAIASKAIREQIDVRNDETEQCAEIVEKWPFSFTESASQTVEGIAAKMRNRMTTRELSMTTCSELRRKVDIYRAEIYRLRAKNEKLRAALVETLDYIDDPYDEFYIEIGQLLESLDAAALKETGDE